MKYLLSFLCLGALALILALCGLQSGENFSEQDFLRIHIRANSNSQADQDVKYKVKDQVVEALIPILANCQTKDDAIKTLGQNFDYIQSVADDVLKQNGFSYSSRVRLSNEHFPTRVYENLTLPEGDYDALILNLGTGCGDNWWCVVYPAFCFTKTKNNDNFVYISQIWEIIKSVMKW